MPLLPARNFEFKHLVQWSIRNFHLCPPWDHIILSPEFNVRLLGLVPLRLFLESQGPGNGMLFGVSSDGDDFEDHGASLDLEVRVQRGENVRTSADPSLMPKKPPATPSVCNCVVLEDVDPSMMELDEGALVLNVTIRTSVKQGHYFSQMLDPHLVALSNDLVSMVADTLYHNGDCDMESKDLVCSMAHFCILKARVPRLFKSQTWNGEEKKWETGLSVDAKRTAKFYLYGRLAIPIPKNQKEELAQFAEFYELKDFESMLKPNPTEFSMGTSLVIEDIGFNILTADTAWVNTWSRKIAISFDKISTRDLEVTATVTSDQSIEFNFEYLDFEIVVPIYMKGSIKLIDHSDKVVREHEICHIFRTRTWTTPFPQFVTRDLVDHLRIKMIVGKMQVTEGLFQQKEVEVEAFEDAEGDLLVFNNLKALGGQLKALYTNQVDCDLELHSGGEVFKVHQAIVMARSTKIQELVLKEQEEAVRESEDALAIQLDFQPKALEKAILYMYSGRIEPDSPEVMGDVMDVADHLQLHLLAEECGEV